MEVDRRLSVEGWWPLAEEGEGVSDQHGEHRLAAVVVLTRTELFVS